MKIAYIVSETPYDHHAFAEKMDSLLSACAFDHTIQLVFTGKSVLGLLQTQDATHTQQRPIHLMFSGLEDFDFLPCWIDKNALTAFQCENEQLLCGDYCELLTLKEIQRQLTSNSFDWILHD